VPPKVVQRQVLSTAAAADVDYALAADNIQGGTAFPDAAWPGYQVIGKTGTTQTAQDAWFIGAIPQEALAVTLFTNEQDSVSSAGAQTLDILPDLPGNATGGYGGAWPAYIWHSFMTNVFAGLPVQALPPTDFNGFVPWNQVGFVPQPKHKKHQQNPVPQPSASTCTFDGFQQPCVGNGGSGGPGNPNPTPGPTCFPVPGNPCSQATRAKGTG
jgi:membrane peptidoglycan carboxypeptidase